MALPKWFTDLFKSKPAPVATLDAEYRNRLVALVKEDVGQRETQGKNRSPLIDSINKAVPGADIGGPYCIAGLVHRGIMRLAKEKDLKVPAWMNTASTQSFYGGAPGIYRKAKGEMPKKGDVCIQQNYNDQGRGHAYILSADQTSINQYSIEYNTDGSGGRDGDGVYERVRTQNGDALKRYRGAVDVVQALIDYNKKG